MRVLFAIGSFELGGAELQMARLAIELHQRGHDVRAWALIRGGPVLEMLRDAGVDAESYDALSTPPILIPSNFDSLSAVRRRLVALPGLPARRVARAWRRRALQRRIAEFSPDVCHVYLPGACLGMLPRAAAAGVPVRVAGWRALSTSADVGSLSNRGWARIIRSTHAFVGNSEAVAADLEERVPASVRVVVIPNGVDIPETVASPGLDDPLGVVVANLNPWKGHADLLTALALLPSPPRVRLIGDGPERAALEAQARAAGLDGRVAFDGAVPDAGRQYLGAQFAVLPSHYEGLPNAVIEAMAAGVPTVATNVGGVRELIEDGVSGLLVPPHDPVALAAAIERLVGDGELRAKLGAAARERAQDLSWSRCVDHHLELYSELLDRSSRLRGGRPGLVDSSLTSVDGE